MEVVHARCAGLDVHKKSVYACVICRGTDGKKRQEIRSFGTMTADLLKRRLAHTAPKYSKHSPKFRSCNISLRQG